MWRPPYADAYTQLTRHASVASSSAGLLLGLGLLAFWMHSTPASMDQRTYATAARSALADPRFAHLAQGANGAMAPVHDGRG